MHQRLKEKSFIPNYRTYYHTCSLHPHAVTEWTNCLTRGRREWFYVHRYPLIGERGGYGGEGQRKQTST
jgi:hypothetical protein